MKDHWPDQQEGGDTLRPLLPSDKNSKKGKGGGREDDHDTYDDDNNFVVRRKQSAPDGEDDSRSASRNNGGEDGMSAASSRRGGGGSGRREDHDDHHDDEAASLAELSNYGSGVDLHPHHKRRSRPPTDYSSRHRSARESSEKRGSHGNGATSESDTEKRRHRSGHRDSGHRSSGNRGGESRRRRPHYDEEDFWSEDNKSSHSSVQYDPRSRGGRNSRSRHGSRSPAGPGLASRLTNLPGVGTIAGFFDGVNIKTVLLCVLGMTMVMKLGSNPPPAINANHGMGSDIGNQMSKVVGTDGGPATLSSPGLRGAMLNDDNVDDDVEDEDADGVDAALALNEEEGAFPSDGIAAIPPPPPPSEPQMQAVAWPGTLPQGEVAQDGGMAQDGTSAQQQGYALPQQQQQQQVDFAQQQQQQQQQAVAQQGYYVQQQPQQPYQVQQQYQQVGANYAVGQASTYAQSPLAYQQQQQMAGAYANGAPGATQQQGMMAPSAFPQQQQAQQQFGSAVDPSMMAPPGSAVQPPPAYRADYAGGQPAVQAFDANGQPLAQQPAADYGAAAPAVPAAAAAVPLVPPPAPEGSGAESPAAVEGSLLGLLGNFHDSWDAYDERAIPMFWHIPKAGGSSIKDAMGGCHRFVQATEFGVTDGHGADTEVAIVYPAVPGVADTDRSPFVNIDSTTVAGIARAKEMGFADAQLAQVVVSPFVYETNDLFTQTAKGRLFSVFRHPIDRAVSMFYYIRVADWEPSYSPDMKDWTIEQYAASDRVENNWMTRQLSNQLGGELTQDNLNKAMEVVRTKILVGLMTKIEPSMTRFEKFFRWTYRVNPTNQDACRGRMMGGGSNSNKANKKEAPKEGDAAWELLAQQNNFDLQLYAYIETLFEEQEQFVAGMPDDFRLVDATCCKCDPPTYPPEGFTCPQAVKNEG